MAAGKYNHLVKPLSVAAMPSPKASGSDQSELPPGVKNFRGPGNADTIVWPNGRDHLEGMMLNFSWGFYTGVGEWHPGMDPHTHPYPECLVYVGLDPTNIDYLGAEMQYCLGKELETYTFDKPTVVVAPRGVPHCPAITKAVTDPKGYSFFIISLGADPSSTWMGDGITEEDLKVMAELAAKSGRKVPMTSKVTKNKIRFAPELVTHGDQYARFVKPLKSPAHGPGPGNADQSVWLYGKDLEGMKLNFSWGYYSKPGAWNPGLGLHSHPADEVLVFVGLDPADINYLGAEAEIEIGSEREKHVFDKPTAVILPAGTPHNSIIIKSVEKPYAVYLISLGAEHITTKLG
jgi:hypothetical protein